MSQIGFFGTYAKYVAPDTDDAVALLNSDNIVGDPFTIEMDYSDGKRQAWIVNPFGFKMGVLDEATAQKIDLCNAKGWKTVAPLALVAFDEEPKPGRYWGQVAIISYDPAYEKEFQNFVKKFGNALGNGIRPSLDLGKQAVSEIVSNDGDWLPSARVPLPKKPKGTAFMKTERTSTDRLVNQARKSRVGCTILSWTVIIIVVALIVLLVTSCTG